MQTDASQTGWGAVSFRESAAGWWNHSHIVRVNGCPPCSDVIQRPLISKQSPGGHCKDLSNLAVTIWAEAEGAYSRCWTSAGGHILFLINILEAAIKIADHQSWRLRIHSKVISSDYCLQSITGYCHASGSVENCLSVLWALCAQQNTQYLHWAFFSRSNVIHSPVRYSLRVLDWEFGDSSLIPECV